MKHLRPSSQWYRKHKSVHALFGSTTVFPASYLVDDSLFPNQNADGRPNGCTSYAIADTFKNLKGTDISHDFQYMKTCEYLGQIGGEVSLDIALKIPSSVGTLPQNLEPANIPEQTENWAANDANWPTILDSATTRQPEAIYVVPALGQDWFDAIRSAMLAAPKTTVIVGTQWSEDFEQTTGVLTDNPTNLYWGHCYEIVGWETVENTLVLVVKSWQGTGYGKGGYCYMTRPLINKLMSAFGAEAAIFPVQAIPSNTTLIQVLIQLLSNLLYAVRNVGMVISYTMGEAYFVAKK